MSAARDLIVIGAGPAGHKAALAAAQHGVRVLIVERERAVGGECVHRGTIPSKSLRETALFLAGLERRSGGVLRAELRPDLRLQSLMRRLARVLPGYQAVLAEELAEAGVEVWTGAARFQGPGELSVSAPDGARRLARAPAIVIATGSRPRTPPDVPVDHEHVLDSDSILSLPYLPRTLAVLGAGVIASEFASVFAALGVQVTMIDRGPRPVGFLDPELSQRFVEAFTAAGGRYLPGSALRSVAWDGVASVVTTLESGEEVRAEKVLCALGRAANLRGLNLAAVGLAPSERGHLVVDEHFRTAAEGVYAAGDVIGPPALAATSAVQGRAAALCALGQSATAPAPSAAPVGIYTIPELASVGLTEPQARERHGDVLVGRADLARSARGLINAQDEGLLKLVCAPSGALLGAHAAGEGACELVHLAQLAIAAGLPADVFVEETFNFPTYAEGYRTAALDVLRQRTARGLRAAG